VATEPNQKSLLGCNLAATHLWAVILQPTALTGQLRLIGTSTQISGLIAPARLAHIFPVAHFVDWHQSFSKTSRNQGNNQTTTASKVRL